MNLSEKESFSNCFCGLSDCVPFPYFENPFHLKPNQFHVFSQILERNYCIIPDKFVGELSAYEFICTWQGYTYYIYIDAKNMNNAIHDDVVLVETFLSGVRKEAKVIRIIKRDIHNLVGEVIFSDNNKYYLNIDDDKRDLVIEHGVLTGDYLKGSYKSHESV